MRNALIAAGLVGLIGVTGCSFLEKVGLKGSDLDLAKAIADCVQAGVDAVKDAPKDVQVSVATAHAKECVDAYVPQVLDRVK